jgi:chemotaxis response regulator CheB
MDAEPWLKLAVVVTNGDWAKVVDALHLDGYLVSIKASPQDALALLADVNPDVAVLGTAMTTREQVELLGRLQECPQIIVLGSEPKPLASAP